MTNLSNDAKSLFASARRDFSPNATDEARVEKALALRLGLTAAAVTGTATATTGASAAAGASKAGLISLGVIMKCMGIGAIVGLGAATGYAAIDRATTKSSASMSQVSAVKTLGNVQRVAPLPLRAEANAEMPSEAASTEPLAAVERAASTPASPKRQSKVDALPGRAEAKPALRVQSNATVEREAKLLSLAAQASRSGDAARSLELLHEHLSSFPSSVLAEERSVELILTLCQLGRIDDARSEAERFARIAPGSLLADSLKSSCVGSR